jgi:hypothetical protein
MYQSSRATYPVGRVEAQFHVRFTTDSIRHNLNDHLRGLAVFPDHVGTVALLPDISGKLDIQTDEHVWHLRREIDTVEQPDVRQDW